jgi:hypothetical protein
MDLMEEVRSWQVRIAFLGDSSNRHATTNPEAYASARTLQNLAYFEEIVDIIDYGGLRSGLTSQINGYQKDLASLRQARKDCSRRRWIQIQREITGKTDLCRIWRGTIENLCERSQRIQEKMRSKLSSYNRHLSRIGMSADSLLRPDVLAPPPLPLKTGARESRSTKVTEDCKVPHNLKYERARLVMQTLQDFERILASNAKSSPGLDKFVRENPTSPVARAFKKQEDNTKAICSGIRSNGTNITSAVEIVCICEKKGDVTIRHAWYEYREQFLSADDA